MCLAHVRVIIAAKGEDNKLIELKGTVPAEGWHVEGECSTYGNELANEEGLVGLVLEVSFMLHVFIFD